MKKALLIGINDYPAGNELTGCIEDINNVKAVIERHGDGSPNFGVKMMPNVQTSGEVMEAIQKLFAGDNDTALLYFSGHGYANNTGAEIVMPQDISTPGLYYTGIQMSTIMNIVNNSHVHNKVVILGITDRGNEWALKVKEYTSFDTPNFADLNRRGAIWNSGFLVSTYARLLIRKL